jgi:hypothetical protein
VVPVVALIVSVAFTVFGTIAILGWARRRPPGTPLSWGEAIAASTFAFGLMFVAYGVVPNQWLLWADNELGWRSDRLLLGPGDIIAKLPFDVTYLVLRDLIASLIYVAYGLGHIALWAIWQGRGKAKPVAIETSSFGRPLVRRES